MTTATATAQPSLKVRRLLAEQRIGHYELVRRYPVQGDHGNYFVTVGDGWHECSCPALREMCSHAQAVLLHDEALMEGEA